MAQVSLSILTEANADENKKFDTILTFIKSHGSIKDSNLSSILARIQTCPFISVLSSMLKNEPWLDKHSALDIALCQNFLDDLNIALACDDINITDTFAINPQTLSNNLQRRNICQNFASPQVPPTWFNIGAIKIWPTIIVKTKTFEKEIGRSVPYQMKCYIDKILDRTSTNIGDIIETEPGHSSLKIKCLNIACRSRVLKYLQEKLPDWSFQIPSLRNPLIMLRNLKNLPVSDADLEEWRVRLVTRNNWPDPDNEVSICYCIEKSSTADIVLSITPRIRERIELKFGLINLGSCSVYAVDYFNIKMCGVCCSYGHSSSKCTRISKCGYCSLSHPSFSCEAEKDASKQKCPNCFKHGTNAWAKNCGVFLIKLQHELEKTNFNYKQIMA